MPDVSGLAVTRELKQLPNAPRVIILTIHDLPQYRAAAGAVGADGFVSKAGFGSTLLPSILGLFPEQSASGSDVAS